MVARLAADAEAAAGAADAEAAAAVIRVMVVMIPAVVAAIVARAEIDGPGLYPAGVTIGLDQAVAFRTTLHPDVVVLADGAAGVAPAGVRIKGGVVLHGGRSGEGRDGGEAEHGGGGGEGDEVALEGHFRGPSGGWRFPVPMPR